MFNHKISRLRQAGLAWSALTVAVIAGGGALCAAPAKAAIIIGAVTSQAPAAGVPRFGQFEATFSVNTNAASPYLPYDPSVPTYAANLRPNEDARRGVSVDALLLPPGQTDWSKAQAWPCYWQEGFTASGSPAGNSEWHLRFAPTQTGGWQYELRATDASGTITTPPATFSCVASASKGFVHVSQADSRYFEYSDGTPFIAAGANAAYGSEINGIMAGLHAGGGTGLIRVWISTQGGMGVVGGLNLAGGAQNFLPYSGHVTTEDSRSGRFCLSIPVPSGFGPQISVPTQAGAAYTLTAWLKGVGESTSVPALWTSLGVCSPVGAPDSSGWQQVRLDFTATGGQTVFNLGDYGSATGHLLVDDITVTNSAEGDLLGGGGSFEWHMNYNQAAAAQLDGLASSAQAQGQFLKLVCLNKFDNAFGSIRNDATNVPESTGTGNPNWFPPNQALGGSVDPNADTPVQRLQKYWARYLVARWGAYPSVQSLEYTNEMDDYNGVQYAGAQSFAHAVHAYTRDGSAQGRIPCTSSTALNGGGLTYDTNFYENPAQYPDIDFADYHLYPDSSDASRGPALPYDDPGQLYNLWGSQRLTSGGPNGLGRLRFTLAGQDTTSPYNQQARFPLPTIRGGQGVWTVSYWMRATDSSAVLHNPQAQVHGGFLPAGYAQFPAGGPTGLVPTTWTQYSGTFTVPDNGVHQGCWLNLYGSVDQSTPTGTGVEFGDVRVTAPDGLDFFRLTFTEPRMDEDSASLASYLAGNKQSYSGDPAIDKPFVLGETEVLGPVAAHLPQDTGGVFARQAFWGGALSPYAQITQWWHEAASAITASGGWLYEGGVERFLQGVPLSNGRYRELGATADPTLRVVGQKDTQAGSAVFWVQNQGPTGDGSEAADWFNLATNPAAMQAVSGTVAIPGLPPGAYEADVWNTSTGQFVSSLFLATSGGVLAVPIAGIGADAAVKVFPANSAHIALHLTASPSVVTSGSKITFTLSYVNQGTSPALGVNLPWPVPAKTRFVSASSGGAYDAVQDTVTWRLGTLAAGASGTVTLTVAAL